MAPARARAQLPKARAWPQAVRVIRLKKTFMRGSESILAVLHPDHSSASFSMFYNVYFWDWWENNARHSLACVVTKVARGPLLGFFYRQGRGGWWSVWIQAPRVLIHESSSSDW